MAPALGGERAAEGAGAEEKPSSRGQGILVRRFPVEKELNGNGTPAQQSVGHPRRRRFKLELSYAETNLS